MFCMLILLKLMKTKTIKVYEEPGRISKLFFFSHLFEIVKIVDKSIILINLNEVGIIGNALFFLRILSVCKHVHIAHVGIKFAQLVTLIGSKKVKSISTVFLLVKLTWLFSSDAI